MKALCFFLVNFLLLLQVKAFNISCRIDIAIKGLEYKSVILAYHYGSKQIMVDTIKLDKEGKGFYSAGIRLEPGIYLIEFPSKNYLDFLINEEQFFSIITDTANYFKNLVIEGSDESELFRQYQVMTGDYEKSSKAIRAKQTNDTSQTYALHANKEKIEAFISKALNEKPGSYLAAYLRMTKEPDFPEQLTAGQTRPTRDFFTRRYYYTKIHYFDSIPFSDTRLLRTHLIFEKLDYYFSRFLSQNSDSLIAAIKFVTDLAKTNDESYRFVLSALSQSFRIVVNPEREKAFVFLADSFYLNNKATWADPKYLAILKNKVDRLRPLIKGNKAPDMELQSPDDKPIMLKDIKAEYLVLYFWSPDCEVCKKETPKLYTLYKKYHSSIDVLAIYVHADKQQWISTIKDKGYEWINAYDPLLKGNFARTYNVDVTPKIYLLDSEKRIIAKNINTNMLEHLIRSKQKK
jgi:thiol-disulfide isomerase/thioredoxin